ncbi:putative tRNA (guanine(26)-N(2))-dimethyltransferase [Helianthus debilis subsp. tardiflorus]
MKARYPAFDWVTTISEVAMVTHNLKDYNQHILFKIAEKKLTFIHLAFSSVQELPDVPLFVSLQSLCATLKCTSPSVVVFRSAVINAGYRISGTHVNPLGLKSDAHMDVIWNIMRCWVH